MIEIMGKKSSEKGKAEKGEDAPKRARTAYNYYCSDPDAKKEVFAAVKTHFRRPVS